MRKNRRIPALLPILAVLCLGGCVNGFNPRGGDAEAAGDLKVSFTRADRSARADLSARTLVPGEAGNLYVRLSFSPETEGPEPVEAETSASSVVVRLSPGTWNIQARGWPDKGDWEIAPDLPILKGQGRVQVQADSVTDAWVLLYPLETGAGLLEYTIQVPNDTASALLRLYPLPETPDSPPIILDLCEGKEPGPEGTLFLRGSLSLDGGFYRGALDISRGAAGALRRNDTIHIYDGLSTEGAYVFAPEDFSPAAAFTSLAALADYLAGLPENTPDTPALITLRLPLSSLRQDDDDLGGLFAALSRYAAVDLQGCAVDVTTLSGSVSGRANSGNLVSLILPRGIQTLGNYALQNCASLEYLGLPDTLTAIGNRALLRNGLIALRIPAGVRSLGDSAFEYSDRLERVDLSGLALNALGSRVFAYAPKLREAILPPALPGKTLPYGTFYSCAALESVVLPSNLETIDSSAFDHCASLSALELPPTLKTIGHRAFADCLKLVPDIGSLAALETLAYEAFRNCGELQTLRLPPSIKAIGDNAFAGCGKLSLAEIPASLVPLIGPTTFAYCRNIQFQAGGAAPSPMLITAAGVLLSYPGAAGEVTIPEGIREITGGAFRMETGITAVSFPASLETLGDSAFYGCSNLTRADFPAQSKLRSLGVQVFTYTKLQRLELPAGVASIGNAMFFDCAEFKELVCRAAAPPALGSSAFNNTHGDLKIYVPDAAVDAYKAAAEWSSHASRINGLSGRPD
jgi:hypothetical protein